MRKIASAKKMITKEYCTHDDNHDPESIYQRRTFRTIKSRSIRSRLHVRAVTECEVLTGPNKTIQNAQNKRLPHGAVG